MRLLALLCLLLTSAACHAATTYSFPLTRDGQPAATIVIAAEPTVAANFAALELQDHVRRITGATLPIATDETQVKGPRVLVGESAATRALRINPRALRYQESLVRLGPDTLVLLGKDADRPLTENGFPRETGKFGRALQFDGEKTVLSLDRTGFSDEAGTLEAWIWMPTARSAKHGTILRMDGGGPWTYHIVQRDMNSDSISYTTYDGTNGHGIGSPPLVEGWHHVVATHDLAAGKMELFIDGKSVGTSSYVKTTCAPVPLYIGALPSDSGPLGNPFIGLIDEVRVSKVVRPAPAEVTQPYALDDATTVLLHFDEDHGQPLNAAGASTLTAPLPGMFEDRGTLDATYDFLERFCGVRWYAPTDLGIVCPQTKTLVVKGSEYRHASKMIHRWITPTSQFLPGPPDTVPANDLLIWKLRMRIGGQPFWVCHSFEGYYGLYLEDHPDWFAQGYGNQRPPQMCYTNPEFIAQVVKDANSFFEGKGAPAGAAAMGDVYGLVPMDNNSWCKCPRCQAEINQEQRKNPQFNNGIASDYIYNFVNKVAREVQKTHPDKWIGALAYSDYAYVPVTLKVEPNIIVQTCLHTRNWWTPSMEANDRKVLDDWRRAGPERPLYLWLYYNFPALNAQYGNFHYFPGFNAHNVVRQMKWYDRVGTRGIFMEHSSEFGQTYLMDQLEFYVTLKMACDPSLDGNALIEEFFNKYYGSAAAPMKALYLRIEDLFNNPKYYPEDIQKSPGHQHQTEALAWGSLGTPERVAELQKLMDQAVACAKTDLEKQRVETFKVGLWDYVAEGRRVYDEHQKAQQKPPLSLAVPKVGAAQGNPEAVDWSAVPVAPGWSDLAGGTTTRQLETRLATDGQYLYLSMMEQTDPAKLVTGGLLYDGDDFEVVAAAKRGGDHNQLVIAPNGKTAASAWQGNGYDEWASGVRVTSDVTAKDRWTVRVALPLAKLLPGGWKPGQPVYLNVYRASPGASSLLAWQATFASGFHDTARLPELTLP